MEEDEDITEQNPQKDFNKHNNLQWKLTEADEIISSQPVSVPKFHKNLSTTHLSLSLLMEQVFRATTDVTNLLHHKRRCIPTTWYSEERRW